MMNRIRLGLCLCVLALGVFCLWLAQEQIALAADMLQQSGGEFDGSSLLRLDPAFALAGENMFALDDQEQSLDSEQALDASDANLSSDPMAVAQLPGSLQAVPAGQPSPTTTDSTAAARGWPFPAEPFHGCRPVAELWPQWNSPDALSRRRLRGVDRPLRSAACRQPECAASARPRGGRQADARPFAQHSAGQYLRINPTNRPWMST